MESSASGQVYLYTGAGTAQFPVLQSKRLLEKEFGQRSVVCIQDFAELREDAKLLVVPGGEYAQYAINNRSNQSAKKISDYVKKGGKYLGICAGAIWATTGSKTRMDSSYLSFYEDKSFYFRHTKSRGKELSIQLFQGACLSPHIVKSPNAFDTKNFCAPSLVDPLGAVFPLCHYSGPAFYNLENHSHAQALLTYRNNPICVHEIEHKNSHNTLGWEHVLTGEKIYKEKPVAALTCSHGKGKVVLSGVHFEVDPDTFDEDAKEVTSNLALPEELKQDQSNRLRFIESVWEALELPSGTQR